MPVSEGQQDFDHYANDYKRLLAEATGDDQEAVGFYARQKLRALKRLSRKAEPVQSILDYGCGIGLSLTPLKEFYPSSDLWGTDPSAKSLAIAEGGHKHLDVRTIPFDQLEDAGSLPRFDLIYVSCVFHHIDAEAHVGTLSTLRQLVRPGGMICIVEHNPANPLTRKIVRDCPFDEGVTLIAMGEMKQRLSQAGWQGIRHRYISFVPASLQALGRLERLLGWCPVGGQYMLCATTE